MPDRNRQNRRTQRQVTGNPIAQNPLLRRGGVHEKSNSVKRQNAKRDLQQRVRAWRNPVSLALLAA
ncbi:hypothetical protein QP938_05275 [Porticoccaceae bacterium LTM1]|nr:hypothetical protein QP938_05275 [Porticoccaceae bacterium LTM1]